MEVLIVILGKHIYNPKLNTKKSLRCDNPSCKNYTKNHVLNVVIDIIVLKIIESKISSIIKSCVKNLITLNQ